MRNNLLADIQAKQNTRSNRLKVYTRFVRLSVALCGVVYELVTMEKPPPTQDVLSGKHERPIDISNGF